MKVTGKKAVLNIVPDISTRGRGGHSALCALCVPTAREARVCVCVYMWGWTLKPPFPAYATGYEDQAKEKHKKRWWNSRR